MLSLFAYVVTAFLVHPNWSEVAKATFLPTLPRGTKVWESIVDTPALALCSDIEYLSQRPNRKERVMPGKRIQIDNESWAALDLLARDCMMTFQELTDEAFADLLKKHGRPVDLRAALRRSAGVSAEVIPLQKRKGKEPRRHR